jgi:uncharacterized hydrophobic protein (TIGR00271 family)
MTRILPEGDENVGEHEEGAMPTTTVDDLARMRDHLFFEGDDARRKISRFWVLLLLASAIASAGVVGDSTATVIGAMIVAPLMTPIMGTVLAITTADRANLVRSVALVVGGACAAIAVGYLMGLVSPIDVIASTSTQVAARVNPRLIDLLAAVATGAVGAFAQCRADVSDTLPGVAIAISLVPPLAVVGLTLEGGQPGQAWGALLLFLTNVAAILLTGVVVMSIFQVQRYAADETVIHFSRRKAIAVVLVFVIAIAVPLGIATASLTRDRTNEGRAARVARAWADPAGWSVLAIGQTSNRLTITVAGALPAPDTAALRRELDAEGLTDVDVRVRLVPVETVDLPGG